MSLYRTPKRVHDENEIYDPKTQHRVNFFGHCRDVQARVRYILGINTSAFSETCGLVSDIDDLLEDVTHTEGTLVAHPLSPKQQYQDLLTAHMQRSEPTIHHIIFNNQHLHGHPSHKDNQIVLERGIHTSLHEL